MARHDLAKSLLLTGCALTASLLLAEGMVRMTRPQTLSGSWRQQTETGLLVNKSRGSAQHQIEGRTVRYQFSEPHLRRVVPPHSTDAQRVLVLGDSFTFGWLLADRDTYVARLQVLIDQEFGAGRFELMNAAAGGWGTADYAFYLEDFGAAIRPHAVLVFLNFDDIRRSLVSPLLEVRDDGARVDIARVHVTPSRLKVWLNSGPVYQLYQWFLEHSHLVQLARHEVLRQPEGTNPAAAASHAAESGDGRPSTRTDPVRLGEALFRRMRDWCTAHDAALWVTTTGFFQFANSASRDNPNEVFRANATLVFSTLAVPFHDITPDVGATIAAAPSTFAIPGDGHPSEQGARLIADAVFQNFLRARLHELDRR